MAQTLYFSGNGSSFAIALNFPKKALALLDTGATKAIGTAGIA
jgi:hypothetical protein